MIKALFLTCLPITGLFGLETSKLIISVQDGHGYVECHTPLLAKYCHDNAGRCLEADYLKEELGSSSELMPGLRFSFWNTEVGPYDEGESVEAFYKRMQRNKPNFPVLGQYAVDYLLEGLYQVYKTDVIDEEILEVVAGLFILPLQKLGVLDISVQGKIYYNEKISDSNSPTKVQFEMSDAQAQAVLQGLLDIETKIENNDFAYNMVADKGHNCITFSQIFFEIMRKYADEATALQFKDNYYKHFSGNSWTTPGEVFLSIYYGLF